MGLPIHNILGVRISDNLRVFPRLLTGQDLLQSGTIHIHIASWQTVCAPDFHSIHISFMWKEALAELSSMYFCEIKLSNFGYLGGLWRIMLHDTLLPCRETHKCEISYMKY